MKPSYVKATRVVLRKRGDCCCCCCCCCQHNRLCLVCSGSKRTREKYRKERKKENLDRKEKPWRKGRLRLIISFYYMHSPPLLLLLFLLLILTNAALIIFVVAFFVTIVLCSGVFPSIQLLLLPLLLLFCLLFNTQFSFVPYFTTVFLHSIFFCFCRVLSKLHLFEKIYTSTHPPSIFFLLIFFYCCCCCCCCWCRHSRTFYLIWPTLGYLSFSPRTSTIFRVYPACVHFSYLLCRKKKGKKISWICDSAL